MKFLLACAILLILSASSSLALDSPQFLLQWGMHGSQNGRFQRTSAVAVGPQGYVYVADIFLPRIQVFTSTGGFVANPWGSQGDGNGQFTSDVRGIAVSPSGDVYATSGSRVQHFSSLGVFIEKWGTEGAGPGQFRYANGICIDSKGDVFVADSDNNRIQQFTYFGAFVKKWGTAGTGPGQFKHPYALAIDSDDNVYVGDLGNYRIQQFRRDSTFVRAWSGSLADSSAVYTTGLALDAYGHVYAPNYGFHNVAIFDTTGDFRYKWGSLGSNPGQFNGPIGVAIDRNNGAIYVTDGDNYRVQKFAGGVVGVEPLPFGLALSVRVVGSPVRHGSLALEISGAPNQQIAGGIYGLSGRLVSQIEGRTDAAGHMNLSRNPAEIGLGPGVYFVNLTQAKAQTRAKFVVLQ